jgi:hypothetical protein
MHRTFVGGLKTFTSGLAERGYYEYRKKEGKKQELDKAATIRSSNILAAKAVADAVRTSLGPQGMDKMIQVILHNCC